LRAKYKTRQAKENGKTVIVKDDHTSPIQAEDFIFEATCHGEIMPDHKFRLTKWSHPGLKDCFPKDGPITIQTGELIAQWCKTPTGETKPSVDVSAQDWSHLMASLTSLEELQTEWMKWDKIKSHFSQEDQVSVRTAKDKRKTELKEAS
jgi:hypothetical protein